MQPEKQIQNDILAWFDKLEHEGRPIIFDRRQAGGFSYKKGIPDVWAAYNGRHIEVEVKVPGKELRPMQEKFALRCKQMNTLHIVAYSVEQVKEFFKENLDGTL